jgi:hypothetical protein
MPRKKPEKKPQTEIDQLDKAGKWVRIKNPETGDMENVVVLRYVKSPKRPRQVLTPEGIAYVERLASTGAVKEEIASAMDTDLDTLENEWNRGYFGAAYKKGADSCNMRLRRAQVNSALSGNSTMLVWLGKVRLGQTERQVDETNEALKQFAEAIMAGKDKPKPEGWES